MWCCSPRLTGDEDLRATKAGSPVQQPPKVPTDAWKVITTHHEPPRANVDGDRQYQTLDKNFRLSRTSRAEHAKPRVDHVATRVDNVKPRVDHVKQHAAHVKPHIDHVKRVKEKSHETHYGTTPRKQLVQDRGHVIYYKGDGNYKMAAAPQPKQNVTVIRSVSNAYNSMSIPRAKLHVTRSNSQREPHIANKPYSVTAEVLRQQKTEQIKPDQYVVRPLAEHQTTTEQRQHQATIEQRQHQSTTEQRQTHATTEQRQHQTSYEQRQRKPTTEQRQHQTTAEQRQKLSVDSGTDVTSDTDSLTEEQTSALNQLDATLDEYNTGVFEVEAPITSVTLVTSVPSVRINSASTPNALSNAFDVDTPVIVTDVLPYGVFEVDEKFDSGLESDEMPSSRTSSLSSNKSLNAKGVISGTTRSTKSTKSNKSSKSKRDRRVTSVSFNLPPDHVDKPYAPLKSHRPMTPAPPPPTFTVSVGNRKSWHGESDSVYVEDKLDRRSSGPFKGSFRKIFYGKYSPKDVTHGYEQGKLYVSPMLLERVSSFESLNDYQLTRQNRIDSQASRERTESR